MWRLKYRVDGREKKLGLGNYPETGLSDARRRRDEARSWKDPSREKQREKTRSRIEAGNMFGSIADEYCRKRRRDGERAWATATATRSEYLLSQFAISIGRVPVAEIGPADVLAAVRKIEDRGNLESARRTLQLAGCVFRYAVATARLPADPTRDLRGALLTPKVTHYGAMFLCRVNRSNCSNRCSRIRERADMLFHRSAHGGVRCRIIRSMPRCADLDIRATR